MVNNMYKRLSFTNMKTTAIKLFIFLACWIFIPYTAHAQEDNRPTNYIGLQLGGGFSNLFVTNPGGGLVSRPMQLGGGAMAGVFYNFEYKHFLIHTGFGVSHTYNRNRFDIQDITASITEYPTMKYHYTFDNYMAHTMYGQGYVPVMLGANYDKWYFLIGAKVGLIPFGGYTRSETDVTLWATDEDIIDPLEGLFTHEMQTYHLQSQQQALDFQPLNVMASAELGITLNHRVWQPKPRVKMDRAQQYREAIRRKTTQERTSYRLSLFADLGLWNIRPTYQANPAAYEAQPEGGIASLHSISNIELHSTFGYEPYRNSLLNNLFVGLKFTMQLELPKPLPTHGALSTPYMYIYVTDQSTLQPISGARVKIQNTTVRKDRLDKNTDSKYGRVGRGFKPGQYTIQVSHANYSSHEPFEFTHVYDYDTIRVALRTKQPFCWPVVDILSDRRVAANFEMQVTDGEEKISGTTDTEYCVRGLADINVGYQLKVNAEGYEPYEQEFKRIPGNDYIIYVKPIQVKTFVLQNMYFATAKTTILTSSKPSLEMLYDLLKENPKLVIRIIGHTDDVGSDAANIKLSQGRANSVKQAMVKRVISSSRIQTQGKVESDPVVANDSDQHRQMNRRVEIEIISGAEDIKIEHILQ